jgi:uncharacterized glyoxalase superfamily protein PhnB
MMLEDPFKHTTLGCGVFYKDPRAALDWLERAFGFERSMVVSDKDGKLVHSEMRFGDAFLIIDSEWADHAASPLSVSGKNTQAVYLRLTQGLDERCEKARRAGAEIIQEPEDQVYGDRTYRARDLEGHVWTFSQTVRHVPREEAEALTGWHIQGWHRDG